jgi:hypothetical protein
MRQYNKGWRNESARHSLAAKGVKTGKGFTVPSNPKWEKIDNEMKERVVLSGNKYVLSEILTVDGNKYYGVSVKGWFGGAALPVGDYVDTLNEGKALLSRFERFNDTLTAKGNVEASATQDYFERIYGKPLAAKGIVRHELVENARKELHDAGLGARFDAAAPIFGEGLSSIQYMDDVSSFESAGYSKGDAKVLAKVLRLRRYKREQDALQRRFYRENKALLKKNESELAAKGLLIKPKLDYYDGSVVGEKKFPYALKKNKTYKADIAVNQPDYEKDGKIFVGELLLKKGEYTIVRKK